MDFDSSQKLQPNLGAEEILRWSGRPTQGIVLRGSDGLMIPFSLLWGGFAFYWEYLAFTKGASAFFLLFGGAFVVVGVYIIFGRFLVDSMKRAKTVYGVTNERVLILSDSFGKKLKSLNLKTLTDVSLSESSNGRGAITFGPSHGMASWLGGSAWPGMEQYVGPQFDLIDDAKSVYDIVRRAQKDSQ